MNFLYSILIFFASFFLKIVALFNKKIKLFVDGRKESFTKLSSIKKSDKVVWFHVASLGEFEQARPIIERIKKEFLNYKIIISFFSPSGYEIRKNYTLADVVCYLPLDSKENAVKLVTQIHPNLAIFIKYEFWPNLLKELKLNDTPTILVSGIFRNQQSFFNFYGGFMRKSLQTFFHFFVQNEVSKKLLNSINFTNVTVSGDTRFDRVSEILQQDNTLDFISTFKNHQYTIVVGSSWKEDEKLLVNYINNDALGDEKFIIVPHNIHPKEIAYLKNSIQKKVVLFSEKANKNLEDYNVFIVDFVGILTKIYTYADVAYVGGGFKTGLHNLLEPAVFGIPVVFGGNNYQKFKEATELVTLKGCISITNQQEFTAIFKKMKYDVSYRNMTGNINRNFINKNVGSTNLIMGFVRTILDK